MVNRIQKLCSLCAIISFTILSLFAEINVGMKNNFLSGYIHSEDSDFWYTSSNMNFIADSKNSSVIKAYTDIGLSLSSIPETALSTAGYYGELSLNKVYAKIRLPFFNDSSMRLSIGKMPISWGYGLYYNSGDIIFGFDPENLFNYEANSILFTSVCVKTTGQNLLSYLQNTSFLDSDSVKTFTSSSDLSESRTMTTWLASLSLPFGDSFSVELIGLPPFDTVLNSTNGRFGGRIIFQPFWGCIESIESGCITQGDLEKTRSYVAFDGTVFVDYNLCSSVLFDSSDTDSNEVFVKEDWNISLSLFKSFTIQTDVSEHALSFRVEGLYYPIENNVNLLTLIDYSLSNNTNLSISSIMSIKDDSSTNNFSCFSSISFLWNVTQGLDLSLQGIVDCVNPDDTVAILFGLNYKF